MEEKKAKAAKQAARKAAKKKEAASTPSLVDQQATADAEAVQQALIGQSQASTAMDANTPERGAGR